MAEDKSLRDEVLLTPEEIKAIRKPMSHPNKVGEYGLQDVCREIAKAELAKAKPLTEKDEYGFLCDENDIPECPNKGQINTMGRPWGEFIIVPSLCQKCIWLYQTPENDYNCLLITKEKRIRPSALVRGTA